jgi:hypothetical protein
MFATGSNTNLVKTTTHKVVLPFYIYAALSFLAATVLLFTSAESLKYFSPQTLAITHTMTLGWGTMIILGASHQLVPVLIEGKLFSNLLAYLSFVSAAIGIPLLVYAFYAFDMKLPAQTGAVLVNAAVALFLINVLGSIFKSKKENVHAIFVFTATIWLFITTVVGLLLVCNFTDDFLPKDSLHYLSLHAHMGIAGWFLLLIIGVGSRLIPMFLISKYNNTKLLWWIYALINFGLISFVFIFLYLPQTLLYLLPVASVLSALLLFAYYCYNSYQQRIRKQVDEQMKLSLLSVLMMIVPILFLIIVMILLLMSIENTQLILLYGFTIFFGWITSIILGMTFKTLPFIVWNKVYHAKAGLGKTPSPKDLFSSKLFNSMAFIYIAGFLCFVMGVIFSDDLLIKAGALFLFFCALLYNANVFRIILHKRK